MLTFEFPIGGYPGPYFHVQKQGDDLHCTVIPKQETLGETTIISSVGNGHWNELVQYLHSQNWKGNYTNEDILDGTHWELTMVFEGGSMECSGSNAYPKGFKKFLGKLNKIFGEEGIEIY